MGHLDTADSGTMFITQRPLHTFTKKKRKKNNHNKTTMGGGGTHCIILSNVDASKTFRISSSGGPGGRQK